MKRYLLFANISYYPQGGWADFRGSFDSIDDAVSFYKNKIIDPHYTGENWDWYDIVDSQLGGVVKTEGYAYGRD